MLKQRWQKFTHPYGRRRMFSPRKWEGRGRILVLGELLAVVAAMAAIPVELAEWGNGWWLVVAATIMGTLALLWYAFVLVSEGEPPLTAQSATRMRLVAYAADMELEGVVFDWDRVDEQGRIPMDMSGWSRFKPESRESRRRSGLNSALLSPEIVTSSEPMWQKAVLQVIDFVEPSDVSVGDGDARLPRPVVRMVEAPGTP